MIASHPLAAQWRIRAKEFISGCADEAARFWQCAADELDAYEREHELERLTLAAAAEESGYSADHLSRLISEGKIENVGRKGAPRIRRGDLPKKPRSVPIGAAATEPDLVGRVLGRDPSS